MLMTSLTKIMTSQHLLQHSFILRKPRVANLVDIIIKIATMLLNQPSKTQTKLKKLEIIC